jgi:Mor family transcriptional regulator
MRETKLNVQNIPEDLIPRIEELPGDLSQLARTIDEIVPGLGVKIVLRVASEFRGTHVYFHNLDAIERRARNRMILEMYDKGTRVPEIARIVRLSERQVWAVLGREPGEEKQLAMF